MVCDTSVIYYDNPSCPSILRSKMCHFYVIKEDNALVYLLPTHFLL